MEYRRDIDGLRALAVLAVVGFHAQVPGFSGGFAGVDTFLVISGYLIGGLILREAEVGTFSLAAFYERRGRRILPALLAMLTASAAAGLILLPRDLKTFGASLAATATMLSNFFFERSSGYFAQAAEATPLLHTWSLAVEEQFYLVFPLLLILALRKGRAAARIVLAAGVLLSFAYSCWSVQADPPMAFYSPLSRAWEFLAGALIPAGLIRRPGGRITAEAMIVAGVALLGFSFWILSPTTPFPGFAALPAVLSTMLLLLGGAFPEGRAVGLLRIPPLVWVGRISYSLYLWHWPLIVFGTYYVLDDRLVGPVRMGMALLAFPIAWASWRFVENPFRKPRTLLSRRALFASMAAGSLVLAGCGAALYALRGLPGRFDQVVQHLDDRGEAPDYGCASRPIEELVSDPGCRLGDPAVPPSFVLWGDSHAAVFQPMLSDLARRRGVSGYSLTATGCPPLFARRTDRSSSSFAACIARNEEVLRLIAERRPGIVFMAARWDVYRGFEDGKHRAEDWLGDDPAVLEAGIRSLRDQGIRVALVLEVPQTARLSIDEIAKARVIGATSLVEPEIADHLKRTERMRAWAAALHNQGLVEVVDPARLLCGPRLCQTVEGDYPLYYDSNHLNARGARFLAPLFQPLIDSLPLLPARN